MENQNEILMDGPQEKEESVGELVRRFNRKNIGAIYDEGASPKEVFREPTRVVTPREEKEYQELASQLITPEVERDDFLRSLQAYQGRVQQLEYPRGYSEKESIRGRIKRLGEELKPRLSEFLNNLYKKNNLFGRSQNSGQRDRIRESLSSDWNLLRKGGVISEESSEESGKKRYVVSPEFVKLLQEPKVEGTIQETEGIVQSQKTERPAQSAPEKVEGPKSVLAKYSDPEKIKRVRGSRIQQIANILGPTPNLPDEATVMDSGRTTTAGKLRQEMSNLQQKD